MIETIMTVFLLATFIISIAVMISAAFFYYWMDK